VMVAVHWQTTRVICSRPCCCHRKRVFLRSLVTTWVVGWWQLSGSGAAGLCCALSSARRRQYLPHPIRQSSCTRSHLNSELGTEQYHTIPLYLKVHVCTANCHADRLMHWTTEQVACVFVRPIAAVGGTVVVLFLDWGGVLAGLSFFLLKAVCGSVLACLAHTTTGSPPLAQLQGSGSNGNNVRGGGGGGGCVGTVLMNLALFSSILIPGLGSALVVQAVCVPCHAMPCRPSARLSVRSSVHANACTHAHVCQTSVSHYHCCLRITAQPIDCIVHANCCWVTDWGLRVCVRACVFVCVCVCVERMAGRCRPCKRMGWRSGQWWYLC
jgi:hypothetical protein